MTVQQPRYSKEEYARRGDEIYQSQVRHQVEEGNHGKIVAIDIETGDFEVDQSEIAACARLRVTPMLKSGLSALSFIMSVDLAIAAGELHNYWSRQYARMRYYFINHRGD